MDQAKAFSKKVKFEYIILALIISFGSYLRLSGVFSNSFPFTYDIGRDLLVAREIAGFEKMPLIGATTGLPGLFYGPYWYYFLGALYIPLGGSPTLYTGFIALTGVLTSFLGFILGKKIYGTFLGIIFAALLSFSPVVISLTFQIWNPTLIPILWILTMFNLLLIFRNEASSGSRPRFLLPQLRRERNPSEAGISSHSSANLDSRFSAKGDRKKIIHFLLLGLVLTLIIDMEIVVGLLFGAGVFISLFFVKPRVMTVKNFLCISFGSLFILLPRIIFDFRHENILSKTLIAGINEMLFGGSGNVDLQVLHKLKVIFELWNDTISLKNPILGVAILLLTIFFVFKNFRTKNEILRNYTIVAVGSTIVTIVGVLFFGHDIWPHYLVVLPLLFVFLVSLGVNGLYGNEKWRNFAVILGFFLILLNIDPVERIKAFNEPLWEGNAAVYRNQVNVINYVYKNANGDKFKYIVYTPPVHDYTYKYLFIWYGQNKYRYLPVEKDAKYLFLIIEPDYEYPSRVTDWLEIRKNDGKIIKEEKLKGGIIVQKREL